MAGYDKRMSTAVKTKGVNYARLRRECGDRTARLSVMVGWVLNNYENASPKNAPSCGAVNMLEWLMNGKWKHSDFMAMVSKSLKDDGDSGEVEYGGKSIEKSVERLREIYGQA